VKNLVISLVACPLLTVGCATPHVVQTTKTTDALLSCSQIELEMAEADRFRMEAQKEKGVTGTNVAAVIFFWPAMIGTYSNANEAIAAADQRKGNLANLYANKKCAERAASGDAAPTGQRGGAIQRLNDLKDALDKGLITKQEYEEKRQRIVQEL
jgi:hypothetical protein